MRTRNTSGPLSVHAIAGSYVVLLGLDLATRSSRGLLGFAIERWDPKERERYWLRGMKLFEETSKGVPPGTPVSLLEHPVQSFQWGRLHRQALWGANSRPRGLTCG